MEPIIDETMKSRILDELQALETTISWNQQGMATTITEALSEIDRNLDIGWHQTALLQPQSLNFHEWMDFALLLTKIHNRDLLPKRYTILRTVII